MDLFVRFLEIFFTPISPTPNTPLRISAMATINPNVANIFTRFFIDLKSL